MRVEGQIEKRQDLQGQAGASYSKELRILAKEALEFILADLGINLRFRW
jgi:hypothetical protein